MIHSDAQPVVSRDPAPGETIVVVPTFNEAGNIAGFVHKFFASVTGLHLLIVDDESPDGTAGIVEKLKTDYPDLTLLSRSGERGLGRALTAGILQGLDQ